MSLNNLAVRDAKAEEKAKKLTDWRSVQYGSVDVFLLKMTFFVKNRGELVRILLCVTLEFSILNFNIEKNMQIK